MKPRILIVDDHDIVRRGLVSLLTTQWEVCGQARNGQEALEMVGQLKPDVVLLDITMPVMGGAETALAIRKAAPRTKIVVFTMHDSEPIRDLPRLVGVDAFLTKTCGAEELKQTLTKVLGETTSQPST